VSEVTDCFLQYMVLVCVVRSVCDSVVSKEMTTTHSVNV